MLNNDVAYTYFVMQKLVAVSHALPRRRDTTQYPDPGD